MKFTSYAQTDTGQVRQLNEDNMRIVIPTQPKDMSRRGELFVVADGMGGHDAGEVASSQAVETIAEVYYNTSGEPDHALKEAIEEANAVIFERAQKEDHHGMGTTVVAASRIDDRLYIAHVGDSRLYLIRQREIYPLTNDHSLVAEQIKAGILTPEEALNHPLRNVISRAVGTTPEVEVEISTHSPLILQDRDVILLCSDGLTEHVREPEIVHIVSTRPPKQAAQALIEAANKGGGRDNITVILGRVGEMPAEDEEVAATAPFNAVSAPTKKLPTLTENQQALAIRKRSRSSGGRRSSVFWLRAFLLFVIVSGIAGAVVTRLGTNWDVSALISPVLPPSSTPSPTTTISLPTALPTFTPVLQPISPTVIGLPTTEVVVPSPTFTLVPTFTTTPTILPTSTTSQTATPEPSATQTAENSESETQSNENQQANLTDTISNTTELTPTLTVGTSSNQASQSSNVTNTPEPSGTVVLTVTLTVTPTLSNDQPPAPTATRRNALRPSSVSDTPAPVLSPTILLTTTVTPSATADN